MAMLPISQTILSLDANLVSNWPLIANSNDVKDSNNGTDTSISYSAAGAAFVKANSSKITLGTAANLKITSAFTYLAVIKMTSGDNDYDIFSTWAGLTNYSGVILRLTGAGADVHLFALSARNTGTTQGTDWQLIAGSTTTLKDGAEHLVSVVWDGTYLKLYVDGALDVAAVSWANAPGFQTTFYPTIGAQSSTGAYGSFMNGTIRDAAVFSRALSLAEQAAHWAGTDGLPAASGMLAFFNK